MDISLSERIRELRKLRGLDQKSLAKLVGLTQGMISHIEVGRRFPSVYTSSRIADALSVSLSELFEGVHVAEKVRRDHRR